MANHVSQYLSIRSELSKEGREMWNNLMARLDRDDAGDHEKHLGFMFWESYDDMNRENMCDNVGAKWAYRTDHDEGGMSMYSAWSPCLEFCSYIAEQIGQVDPGVQLALTYEDEFCNFIGAAIFDAGGLEDQVELDSDEFIDMILEGDEELQAHFDPEEREFDEEGQEMLWEVQWDRISDWQWNSLESMLGQR